MGVVGNIQSKADSVAAAFMSPAIWGNCPVGEILTNPNTGVGFIDDFHNAIAVADGTTANTNTLHRGWRLFAESNGTNSGVFSANAAAGGGQAMANVATAGRVVSITWGDGAPFVIGNAAANKRKLWCEWEAAVSSITAGGKTFVGLVAANKGGADAVFNTSASGTLNTALADVALIGFYILGDDGDDVGFGYQATGQTAVEVAGQVTTVAASTAVRLGLVFDPTETTNWITPYVGGVAVPSGVVTKTAVGAATFPNGVLLTPIILQEHTSTTAITVVATGCGCMQLWKTEP